MRAHQTSSLLARIDADTSGYDTIGKQAAADFANPDVTLVPCAWDYPRLTTGSAGGTPCTTCSRISRKRQAS